ncbi:MAG: putative signal transducing protein [Solirubrobacteraceae bacterium]
MRISAREEHRPTEQRRRARKIKPEYAEGPLVKVAEVDSQPEAEFVSALLLEEGIPSVSSGLIGGYAPVIGRREVLVPESGSQAAREALAPKAGDSGD